MSSIKIKKIKSVQHYFWEHSGPGESITLGFSVTFDDNISQDYILGTTYFGPGMNDEQAGWFERTEKFIDKIVEMSIHYKNLESEL